MLSQSGEQTNITCWFKVSAAQLADMPRSPMTSHCPLLSHKICCITALVSTVVSFFLIAGHMKSDPFLRNGGPGLIYVDHMGSSGTFTQVNELNPTDHTGRSEPFPLVSELDIADANASDQNLKTLFSELATSYRVDNANCAALFHGDKLEQHKSHSLRQTVGRPLNDEFYMKESQNCQRFKTRRGYVNSALNEEERDFPIAFSILAFKDAETVERLLRSIYRPQNIYCIHIDRKAKKTFHLAVSRIARCFENVFLTSHRVDVIWGTFSVLEPELICMDELWPHRKWNYFINLTGQEFPLRTNLELVKILKALKGANAIHSSQESVQSKRWGKIKAPHGIRPVKGPVHIAANRGFVDYILHNQTAFDFLQWTRHTDFPDETFFTSLNFNPHLGIPGSYSGDSDDVANVTLTRYKEWFRQGVQCATHRFVRGICILTTGDLPFLDRSKAMFANKFYLDEDRLVIGCLEERIFNRTRDEVHGLTSFDTSFYENLPFVRHQITLR